MTDEPGEAGPGGIGETATHGGRETRPPVPKIRVPSLPSTFLRQHDG